MSKGACLDTSVLVKLLTEEEDSAAAHAVAAEADVLYLPAFAWAEVGSVLRQKVRSGALDVAAAAVAWDDFLNLAPVFVQDDAVARRAWEIADAFALPTLYDAAFLAVAELAPEGPVPFWTADAALASALADRHPLVRPLRPE